MMNQKSMIELTLSLPEAWAVLHAIQEADQSGKAVERDEAFATDCAGSRLFALIKTEIDRRIESGAIKA